MRDPRRGWMVPSGCLGQDLAGVKGERLKKVGRYLDYLKRYRCLCFKKHVELSVAHIGRKNTFVYLHICRFPEVHTLGIHIS